MLGAIAGDMIGAPHEGRSPGLKEFTLFTSRSIFTDDTVLTVAIADAILSARPFGATLREWGQRYPNAGYGSQFYDWLHTPSDPGPYNSYGNGSAMRVAPIGWAFDEFQEVVDWADKSAWPTHNHPEGLKGAHAVAGAIWAARQGPTPQVLEALFSQTFGYDINAIVLRLREGQVLASTCQDTVPAAAIACLSSGSFEDAVRKAVSFGGDTDTLACIAGAIAEAWFGGVPREVEEEVRSRLDKPLLRVVDDFTRRYCKAKPRLTVVRTKLPP
jgi:ADP-ribosylglycohydrolase